MELLETHSADILTLTFNDMLAAQRWLGKAENVTHWDMVDFAVQESVLEPHYRDYTIDSTC